MKVRVLFPASPPKTEERFRKAVEAVQAQLQWVQLEFPREVAARKPGDPEDYLAGTDLVRAGELADLLATPGAVGWFGRGGYGLTRILRELKRQLKRPDLPAPRLIGYSDITALFAFCKSEGLLATCIHGPMLCAFCEQPNPKQIQDALDGRPHPIPVKSPRPELDFEGSIWGGNLAVLASLCGTPWLPKVEGGAIFLEDVDEPPYRLDRFLTQLHDSGFFSHTNKVFLGTFTEFKPEKAALDTILRRCGELGLDVLGHLPIGHSEPHTPLFLDHRYRYLPDTSTLQPLQG